MTIVTADSRSAGDLTHIVDFVSGSECCSCCVGRDGPLHRQNVKIFLCLSQRKKTKPSDKTTAAVTIDASPESFY